MTSFDGGGWGEDDGGKTVRSDREWEGNESVADESDNCQFLYLYHEERERE